MNDQKKMLIESMRKLISHVSSNKQHQIQIYCSLTKGDLVKILTNLEDHNPILRKMSMRLICQLLYKNPPLKQQFGQLMGIRPVNGHVINISYRSSLIKSQNRLSKDQTSSYVIQHNNLEAMSLIKSKAQSLQLASKSLCWFINSNQSPLTFQLVESRDQQFLDPKQNIMGITVATQVNPSKSIHQSVVLQLRASYHRPRTSITSAETDRYSRGIKDIRVKRQQDKLNMSRQQYKINSKPTPVKYQQRVRTDGSQHFRYRHTKGSNGVGNGSPQSVTLRAIDKSLRQKKNQRQNISTLQTPGQQQINIRHMSDRLQRQIQFNSKVKSNSFMSQIKNSYMGNKQVSTRDSRPKNEQLSHRQSFDSNYKPSETFLKRYKQQQRRLY